MKWVLPLIRHLVLEEHMTSPLMQSKAICNSHHCTFLIFMNGIGHRGMSWWIHQLSSCVKKKEQMNTLLLKHKGKLDNTEKTMYLLLIMEINPVWFLCIILETLNICLSFFPPCPLFFSLSFLILVTFQRVDGGLMSNGRWVYHHKQNNSNQYSSAISRPNEKKKLSNHYYYILSVLSFTCLNTTFPSQSCVKSTASCTDNVDW